MAPRDRSKRSKAQGGAGASGAGGRNNKRSVSVNDKARSQARGLADGTMPMVIVGLGASAGGINALEEFFSAMPRESGGAFVVVLHLDPRHTSAIPAILGRRTTMPVSEAVSGERIQSDHVYIIPPNRVMKIESGRLRLSPPTEPRGRRMPIDHLLSSLGEDQRQRAIGIVLSGTGSDGTIGMKAIKSAGGLTMAQDPATAEQDGMVRSAIAMGVVDHVLAIPEMPDHVVRYAKHAYTNADEGSADAAIQEARGAGDPAAGREQVQQRADPRLGPGLQTSKEELQSLNEELLTVNFQLQSKLHELERRNDDLDNLLRSTDLAAIFLDSSFCIKWFSPAMTSLLSLIPSDIGRPLGDFAQRFTDPNLLEEAEAILSDSTPITREIRTHDGRWYLRRLLPYRTRADSINGIVITFTDIHAQRLAEEELKERNESLERTIAARTAILTVLQDVAGAANRATSVDEAIRMAIQLVCVHAGFDLGHAWRVDDATHTVVPLDVWYVAPGRDFTDFMDVTMRTVLGPGDGVIRRTLALGEPQWIEDVRGQEFVRGAFAKFGIRSVATLPVLVEGRPVVVLEIFSSAERAIPSGGSFLPSMRSVGIHIGHVIERQTLEKQVADQTDRERRSIGQELHDSVGQSLAGLAMMTRELMAQIEAGQDRPKLPAIETLHRGIEGAKNELRNVIRGMLPVEFDGNGLMNALLDLAEATEATHSVKCRFVSDDPDLVAIDDGFMGAQLYRIAQEAVRNAVTHGDATGIEIALRGRRRIELEVTDNGHGDWSHADTRGSGVRIMRYRADLIGGRIEVVAERGKGTRVICIVPRRPQAATEPASRT